MSFFQNLLGIIGVEFQFNNGDDSGGLGSKWVSVEDAIEARNGVGDQFVVGRGNDPSGPNDWVTLSYAEDNFSNLTTVREIRFVVAQATVASTEPIPTDGVVIDAEIKVTSAYSVGGTLQMIRGADELMATTDNNPQATGYYSVHQNKQIAAGGTVQVVVGGSPGAGDSVAIVRFVATPLP